MVMETKKDLIAEFRDILNKLIKQNKLKYYPFKRDLKYFNKDLLKEGIRIHKEKLEK